MDEIIIFDNKKYYGRSVCLNDHVYLVAESSLNEALFDDKGNYVNEEARKIDEGIFFFMDEQEMNNSGGILASRVQDFTS